MSDIGGIWRTVGGRRIFIKDGEDLAAAMKNSGKFGKRSKNNEPDESTKKQLIEEAKELMDDIKYLDPEEEGFEEALADIKESYKDLRKREGSFQSKQSKEVEDAIKQIEKEDSDLKKEYMNISQKERAQAYADGKNWKDLVKEKRKK